MADFTYKSEFQYDPTNVFGHMQEEFPRESEFDVVIIGAGPNGLIAGAYLAKAGLRVAICERRFEAGGGLATEENLYPCYSSNPHVLYHMMVDFMPAIRDFELDGLEDDNLIHHWSATGRDIEFRNTGLIGGTWAGSRHDEDQLWTNRPIPELARYRTPIEGLYHAHQTSGHPGALCLMAIPYNLMHILIEDGIAEPGDWWYASPWYIPQQGKISARRG